MLKRFLIAIIAFTLLLTAAAVAESPDLRQVNCVVNPRNGTLYTVNNFFDPPSIDIYRTPWNALTYTTIDGFPAGSNIYGLAVSSDGAHLYVSISNGAVSEIRVFTLTSQGLEDTTTPAVTMSGDLWVSADSPSELALSSDNAYLFVTNQGRGTMRMYRTSDNSWVKDITTNISAKAYIGHIAVTPLVRESGSGLTYYTCKIYLARSINSGEIYVFNYSSLLNSVSYVRTITHANLRYPSQLKVVNGQLYVSVKNSGGPDVMVYETAGDTLVSSISSGVAATAGWVSFDLSSDANWLYFKKATDALDTHHRLFRYDFAAEELIEIINDSDFKSDGLALSADGSNLALAYSQTGHVFVISSAPEGSPPLPAIVNNLVGVGEAGQARLTWTNPAANVSRVILARNTGSTYPRINASGTLTTPGEIIYDNSAAGQAGRVVNVTDNNDGANLAAGQYSYAVYTSNGSSWQTTLDSTAPGVNAVQVNVAAIVPNDPPAAFGKLTPPNGWVCAGDVVFTWQPSVDPDGDTISYTFSLVDAADTATTLRKTTVSATTYTEPASSGILRGGRTYLWQVTANDGHAHTVYADDRSTPFEFHYVPADFPVITSISPANRATDVALDAPIRIDFSEPMNKASIVVNLTGVLRPSFILALDGRSLTIPHARFAPETTYSVAISGADADDGRHLVGEPLTFSFTTGTGGGGETGEITFNLYQVDEGNINWVSIPFTDTRLNTTVDLGTAIAGTFAIANEDSIAITVWDPETQSSQQTTGDYVGGRFYWDPEAGQPLAVGQMYQVSILRAGRAAGTTFSTTLTIGGNVPPTDSINFDLFQVDGGNSNWLTIPWYNDTLASTVALGESIASTFVPLNEDSLAVTLWDPETQTSQQTSGDYVGGRFYWDPEAGVPISRGRPYIVSILRASRAPGEVFTTTWPRP